MLKKIKVYGTLRKFLGQAEFEVDLNTPKEAISFLVCNFKGIEKHMADQFYTIQVGAKVITEDLLNLNSKDDIKIIPVVHGNFLGILLGAGALFGGSAVAAGTTFLGSGLLATVVSGALTSIGTSMVVDGVTSMLSPQQSNLSPTGQDALDPAALASNYSFTGLTNISRAGIPVNLVYGEIVVGSIVVSNGVDTVQVEGNN
jgi:predicted phage tail protein|tara:strand:+ start:1020 stop:1622 length:603 start_codon:yes stop_codon:yes gene_type:complete